MTQRELMCCSLSLFFFALLRSARTSPRWTSSAIFSPSFTKYNVQQQKLNFSIYPFLYGVGLTDGAFCSGNAAGDATIALAHAPKFTADFLCAWVKEWKQRGERKKQEERNKAKSQSFYTSTLWRQWSRHALFHPPLCSSTAMPITHGGYVLLCTYAPTT